MITSIKRTISEHYATFLNQISGEPESHKLRVLFQLIFSLVLALLIADFSGRLVSVSVTTLSILTGFTFSALFSLASNVKSGLPEPSFPEDKDDLSRMLLLASNFRSNASYFLPMSLFCIVLLLSQMIDVDVFEKIHKQWPDFSLTIEKHLDLLKTVSSWIAFIFKFSIIFIFIEVIYTFYRMSLSMLYILRIRDEYITGHEGL